MIDRLEWGKARCQEARKEELTGDRCPRYLAVGIEMKCSERKSYYSCYRERRGRI